METSTFEKARRSFPQAQAPENKSYKVSPLKPGGVTQEEMNATVIRQFKQLIDNGDMIIDPATVPGFSQNDICKMTLTQMITANPDGFRMVMKHTAGGGAADTQVTSSESMGYGMLMLVIMAGQDQALGIDVKAYFDGMFRSLMYWNSFIKVNGNDSHLMSWQLIQPAGPGTAFRRPIHEFDPKYNQDDDAATDGDLDIAYALLLADKQWGSSGKYNYFEYALAMLNDIWERCIDCDSKLHKEKNLKPNYHVKAGDWASDNPHWVPAYGLMWDITRLSDHMPDHFKAFKAVDPVHDWQKVIDSIYDCIQQLCVGNAAAGGAHQAAPTGLLPDFAMFDRSSGTWRPVPATDDEHWESPRDGDFSQNACRMPWRLGTDYFLSGKTPIDSICLQPMNKHLKTASGCDFSKLTGYLLNGTPHGEYAPCYSNPALVLAAAFGDQEWLDNGWNYAKDLMWYDDQYGSYLNVLALIVISGNYWSPVEL